MRHAPAAGAGVEDVPERQPDLREERRGPRVDAPEKAVAGFLRSAGATREQCEERETAKGRFLFAVVETEGRDTASGAAGTAARRDPENGVAQSMRWGSGGMRWVRPLESALCLFGGEGYALPTSARRPGTRRGDTGFSRRIPSGYPASPTTRRSFARLSSFSTGRSGRRSFPEGGRGGEGRGLVLREDPGLLEEVAGPRRMARPCAESSTPRS